MKKLIYALSLLCVFLGCRKEQAPEQYPITLVSTDYNLTSPVRLFTKSGQVNDQALLDKFLSKDSIGYFYSNVNTIIPMRGRDTIVYKNKDLVIFPEPGLWGKRIPKQMGDYIMFNLKDTLTGFAFIEQESEFKDVVVNVGISKPFYQIIGTRINPGQIMLQRTFDSKIAKGNSTKLEFPMLTYMITRTRNGRIVSLAKKINNAFDSNVIKFLGVGDTLAIQEGVETFEARR